MTGEIIGKEGTSRYLILLGTHLDSNSKMQEQWGEVIDLDNQQIYGPDYLSVWYSHGAWEPYTGDQSILPGLYKNAKRAK